MKMNNIEIEPRDIVKLNGEEFYVLAERKTNNSDFVMLTAIPTGEILFGAKDGNKIIHVTDEKLIGALTKEMMPEAKASANKLADMAKNVLNNLK